MKKVKLIYIVFKIQFLILYPESLKEITYLYI